MVVFEDVIQFLGSNFVCGSRTHSREFGLCSAINGTEHVHYLPLPVTTVMDPTEKTSVRAKRLLTLFFFSPSSLAECRMTERDMGRLR